MPAHRPPANIDMSMKLITEPPWSDPPMFMCCSVGNMRQTARPWPSGLNSSRPVAAAKLPRGKSPQLYQPGLSASGVAPVGTPTSSIRSCCWGSSLIAASLLVLRHAFGDELLGLRDRLGRAQPLGADVRAVHDRVAAIKAVRVLQLVQALARRFVAAIGDPAIGLEQNRGPEELVGVPPIARAAGRAAEAKDALVEAI